MLASCSPSKEDYRSDYVKGCVTRYAADSTVASEAGRKLVEDYCNCEGDALNAQLSVDQWREMNKGSQQQLDHYLIQAESCKVHFEQERLKLTLSTSK